MAYLSDQKCSHHGKAANAFVTMGWSGAPFMLSGLALEEVGMNPIMQRSGRGVGVGRHCIEGVGWHSGRH